MITGHRPTWRYTLPDGLALCTGCKKLITVQQLGVEVCPGLNLLGAKEFAQSIRQLPMIGQASMASE